MKGINGSGLEEAGKIQLSQDIPSICAEKLISGEADLGLIPVAILPLLGDYHIHGNTCIGSIGKVDSVLLLSDVPLEEIKTIVLDNHSRTSVMLCKLLARDFWKIIPNYVQASTKTLEGVEGTTAGVLIGDRVFDYGSKYKYQYDLSEAWYNWTGLPFVFAVWASVKDLGISISEFETALETGLEKIDEAIAEAKIHYPEHYPIENYLRNRISYRLDSDKLKGLETFLTKLSTLT